MAIFSNFWSCWSLLNVYVTMVHQEVRLTFRFSRNREISPRMAVSVERKPPLPFQQLATDPARPLITLLPRTCCTAFSTPST